MDEDILRSNIMVKKSSNNALLKFCHHSSLSTSVSYYTNTENNTKKHVIFIKKGNYKMLINDLNILENMFHNITIYTDDKKLKDNVPSSLECVDCDVRKDFRVIYSMGTVMAIKRHNKEVDDILHDIMSVVDSISLKSKNFIKFLERTLDVKYSLSEYQKKYILQFYKKYKKKYNNSYKQAFKDIVFTMLNEKTINDLEKIEELMLNFTEVSLKYFQIVLDWVYMYWLENTDNILVYYAEEDNIKNLKKYVKGLGYITRFDTDKHIDEEQVSKCVIQ